jgi:hypothetical protein
MLYLFSLFLKKQCLTWKSYFKLISMDIYHQVLQFGPAVPGSYAEAAYYVGSEFQA